MADTGIQGTVRIMQTEISVLSLTGFFQSRCSLMRSRLNELLERFDAKKVVKDPFYILAGSAAELIETRVRPELAPVTPVLRISISFTWRRRWNRAVTGSFTLMPTPP